MYTAHIGKRFVEIYNKRMGTELSARDFFEKVYFKYFFDYGKFLLSPAGTPLFQLIAQRKTYDSKAREIGLRQIHRKIEDFKSSPSLAPDMSFAIGFGSADYAGTTSGQITNIQIPFDDAEIYSSWIGAGFGIGIQGGQNMLIDNEDVLWSIYEGWEIYRSHVEQNEGIENKIDTWNGVWLQYRFSSDFKSYAPTANFQPIKLSKDQKAEMNRPSWIQALYSLARTLKEDKITAYVYSFSQMNTTVGFIQLYLPEVRKPFDFFERLFSNSVIKKNELSKIYETQYGFMRACENGSIGLRQLEPKDLREHIKDMLSSEPNRKKLKLSETQHQLYISWITAMLNNIQLNDLANETATALFNYYSKGEKGTKNQREQQVKEVLKSKSRLTLITTLSEIMENSPTDVELYKKVKNESISNIAPDNINLFVALINFDFKALKAISLN